MYRWTAVFSAIALLMLIAVGCSGAGRIPVTPDVQNASGGQQSPDLTGDLSREGQARGTYLWGYYDLIFDVESRTVEAVPNRSGTFTANVTTFLNANPAGLGFTFNGVTPGTGYVDVDVDITIRHPLNVAKFDGYDVRGVFFGEGSATMDYNADLVYPTAGMDQVLRNADGYTRWFNPVEFKVAGLFGYTQGRYAAKGYTATATLNPYKYFGEGLGATDDLWTYLESGNPQVGYFLHGSSNTRNYVIRFPIPLPGIKYGYAVIANWECGDPSCHPSYAAEAVGVRVADASTLYYVDEQNSGGDLILDISVFDWDAELKGGVMEDYAVNIESTVLSSPYQLDATEMTPTASGDHWYTYHVEIAAENVTSTAGNELWVVVEDAEADYTNPFGVPNDAETDPVAACFRFPLYVYHEEPPWIEVTVPNGGEEWEVGSAETIEWEYGGWIEMVDILLSLDSGENYTYNVSLYDLNDGIFEWDSIPVEAAGETCRIRIQDNANPSNYDDSDADFRIFETGLRLLTPNGGEEWGIGSGQEITWDSAGVPGNVNIFYSHDNFMSHVSTVASDIPNVNAFTWPEIPNDPNTTSRVKVESVDEPGIFDVSDEDFSIVETGWARTWGGAGGATYSDVGTATVIDGLGSVYVLGAFESTVDFDPGPDVDEHTATGGSDICLAKYNSRGDFLWARTWGGSDGESGNGIAVDGSGNTYVTGSFYGTVDFDPGAGVVEHTSGNSGTSADAFLSEFGSSGNLVWVKTWGGSWYGMHGRAVASNGSDAVCVTGSYWGTGDFDPSAGVDEHTSAYDDIFLSMFDSGGAFLWARVWGGSDADYGNGVACDDSGSAYVTGDFMNMVDFDPGAGEDYHTEAGSGDVFLSRFDPDGNFLWARTWGGADYPESASGVAVDDSGDVYVTGGFRGTVDFDPGPGVDEHTPDVAQFADVFLSKFDSGGGFIRAVTWGGTFPDSARGVGVDGSGNAYVAGGMTISPTDGDVYLRKLDLDGNFLWERTWGGTTFDFGYGVACDSSGIACVTGQFFGTVDFDPGPGVDEHTSTDGGWDAFISRFPPSGDW